MRFCLFSIPPLLLLLPLPLLLLPPFAAMSKKRNADEELTDQNVHRFLDREVLQPFCLILLLSSPIPDLSPISRHSITPHNCRERTLHEASRLLARTF